MMCDNNSSLVRSALYNNDGVQHMNKGCYDNAIASFTMALEILRPVSVSVATASYYNQQQQQQQQQVFYHHQHHHHTQTNNTRRATTTTTMMTQQQEPQQARSDNFQQQRHQSPQQQRNSNNNNVNNSSCYTPSSPMSNKKQRTTSSQPVVVQRRREPTEHTNFIFRDSIDIPVQSILRSEINEKIVTKLSIVVMYNLGLSFHLSALSLDEAFYSNNIDRLVRAKMLYEYAFEMHMSEVGGCEDVTLLYTLALMNNLGLIYHALGQHQKSQHCFYNMLSTMMFLLEADDARKIKQWDGLLSNVFAYVFLNSKIAAPAA